MGVIVKKSQFFRTPMTDTELLDALEKHLLEHDGALPIGFDGGESSTWEGQTPYHIPAGFYASRDSEQGNFKTLRAALIRALGPEIEPGNDVIVPAFIRTMILSPTAAE